MYKFDAILHGLPAQSERAPFRTDGGGEFEAFVVPQDESLPALALSFEEAAARLASLDGLYFEPDGSFVMAGGGEARWQVEGVVYDRGGRVQYVELRGSCPPEDFDALLTAFSASGEPLLFQLRREAVFLEENEFRRNSLQDRA